MNRRREVLRWVLKLSANPKAFSRGTREDDPTPFELDHMRLLLGSWLENQMDVAVATNINEQIWLTLASLLEKREMLTELSDRGHRYVTALGNPDLHIDNDGGPTLQTRAIRHILEPRKYSEKLDDDVYLVIATALLPVLGEFAETQDNDAWGYLDRSQRPGRVQLTDAAPPVVGYYRARPEEAQVADGIESTTVLTAVHGIGGVGKSQLATQLLHQQLDTAEPVEVIAWIRAADDHGINDLLELADRVGLPKREEEPDQQRCKRIWDHLRSAGRRWFIVIDNVHTPDNIRPLLPPTPAGGRIIVTSRHTDWDKETVIEVDCFDKQTGANLLLEISDSDPDDSYEQAEELSIELGGLALALVLAGRLCRRTKTLGDFLNDWRARPDYQYLGSKTHPTYDRAITALWNESLTVANKQSPSAGHLLLICCHLDWTNIDWPWLRAQLTTTNHWDNHTLNQAAEALADLSLIELDHNRIAVKHNTIADGYRADPNNPGQLTEKVITDLTYLLTPPTTRPNDQQLRHIDAIANQSNEIPTDQQLTHIDAIARRRSDSATSDLLPVIETAGLHHLYSTYSRRAIPIWHLLFEAKTQTLGSKHLDTLTAQANLAVSYAHAGQLDNAISTGREVLHQREQILGSDHPDTLSSRANLAVSLKQAGHAAETIALEEQLILDNRSFLGLDHPLTLASEANLAVSLAQVGRIHEAITVGQQALEHRQRVLGRDHPDTITSQANLAYFYGAIGSLNEATTLGEKVLESRQRVLGYDHPETLNSRGNLGMAYRQAGRLEEAINLEESLVADRRRLLGVEHPDTLTSQANLAIYYRESGRVDQALDLEEELLTARHHLFGPDHPDTITSQANLTISYMQGGRIEEALALGHEALNNRQRVLGHDHPETLNSRTNLAMTYRQAGRIESALTMEEELVVDRQRILGIDHPDTLRSQTNLGIYYRQAGHLDEALQLEEEVLARGRSVLGPDHPDTLVSQTNLAITYRESGLLDEAIALGQRALEDHLRVLGPDHLRTLTSQADLAMAYREAGHPEEAIATGEKAFEDRQRILGPDHPDTLISQANLAIAYGEFGRLSEAIRIEEKVAATRRRTLGHDHPDTLLSQANLAISYAQSGRISDAVDLTKRTLELHETTFGATHPTTIELKQRLAHLYFELSSDTWALGVRLQEQAVQDLLRNHGEAHPSTVGAKRQLGRSLSITGRTHDAIMVLEEALADSEQLTNSSEQESVYISELLSECYYKSERFQEAIALQENVVASFEQVLGNHHSEARAARERLLQWREGV